MKQYLLSVIEPSHGDPPSPEFLEGIMRDVRALSDEMKAAGAWVFAAGLYPPSAATVVRAKNDEAVITDGPFTEGKEHIGGFSIVKAADLDDALEWGRKLARATTLPIEVRPIREDGSH
ncbi:MAG TPA: YciI family protein [Vicinamibacterales bacterium]|nr:YciI family protein [Vicinamibacterales bacterium]